MFLQKTSNLLTAPKKIVSLVPSQTELLCSLGLHLETVGITKFCVHPAIWHSTKKRVGGTKNLDLDAIQQLKPDLIIANREENEKEQIEWLAQMYPVWLTDVRNLNDALNMIEDMGRLTGKNDRAMEISRRIRQNFTQLKPSGTFLKTSYFIWNNPYMCAGGDTFISDMMTRCGLVNIHENQARYPETGISELKKAGCNLLLLSSEPYPFQHTHILELQQQLPGTDILLVDGEMFSWYGSRLLKSPAYFNKLLAQIHTK